MYIKQAKQSRHGQLFGTAKRAKEHVYEALHRERAGCRTLNHATCKYGPTAFDWITLQTVPAEQADAAEVQIIAAYGTFENPDHYNLTPGGQGYSITAAQREKQALKMRKHRQDRSVGIAMLDNAQHRGYKEAHANGLPPPPRLAKGFPKSANLAKRCDTDHQEGQRSTYVQKKGYTTKTFLSGTPAEQRARAQAHVDQLGRSYHSNANISDEEEEFAVPCSNGRISVNRSMPMIDKENQGPSLSSSTPHFDTQDKQNVVLVERSSRPAMGGITMNVNNVAGPNVNSYGIQDMLNLIMV
ncbi:hypothetical protein WJX77_007625 [Trebouxia sp. C0004]